MTPKQTEDLVNSTLQFAYEHGITTSRTDPTRSQYLRVSGLPFCSRRWFLDQVTSKSTKRHEKTSDLYYVNLGTTVHELLQGTVESCTTEWFKSEHEKNLPHRAVLVQDWLCRACGHRHRFEPRPKACTWCGEHGDKLKPLEHQVRHGKVILGHMDGTLAFPDPDNPKAPYSKSWVHIPFDYKTCSAAAQAGNKLPYDGNKVQLTAYAAIKRYAGYNVPGVVLVYVARDNPNKRKNCYVPLKYAAVLKNLAKWEEEYLHAREVTTLASAMQLPPKVESGFAEKCSYCPYIKACESNSRGDNSALKLLTERTLKFVNSPTRNSSWPEA